MIDSKDKWFKTKMTSLATKDVQVWTAHEESFLNRIIKPLKKCLKVKEFQYDHAVMPIIGHWEMSEYKARDD